MTIAVFFVAKKLSHVLHIEKTLPQYSNSLSEPFHELTCVVDFFVIVLLRSFTMELTMNEESLIAESSLYEYAMTMIATSIEVAHIFCAIAEVLFALTVPLAIPEISFIVANESVLCSSFALMLLLELENLVAIAIWETLVEGSNVHARAIIIN